MTVCVGVVRETASEETRVAVVPEVASKLVAAGLEVCVETGAGARAGLPDAAYENVRFAESAGQVLAAADVLLTVQPPASDVVEQLRGGAAVIGMLQPYQQEALVRLLQQRQITSFAMELVPRISRAQSMDVLSSQAAAAGYKAVLIAANALEKFFPMLTTAAGTIRPASVLVIGAGVAGLQAIATARRLGAIVQAFDVRAATREEIESLGARFLDTGVSAEGEGGYARELNAEERQRQQSALADHIAKMDVVITTAAVPGKPAPRIITRETVERMQPGAVIVDLAAESGGNCELTSPGEVVSHSGVKILGPLNLPSKLGRHASEMYARNLYNFLKLALADGAVTFDWNDEIFSTSVLTHAGEIRHERIREALEGART